MSSQLRQPGSCRSLRVPFKVSLKGSIVGFYKIGALIARMQEVARSRNNLLGVYSHRSSEWKNRQKQLLLGAESKSLLDSDNALSPLSPINPINPLSSVSPGDVWQVLVSLDGTWWSLRASLDKYLNQARRHWVLVREFNLC